MGNLISSKEPDLSEIVQTLFPDQSLQRRGIDAVLLELERAIQNNKLEFLELMKNPKLNLQDVFAFFGPLLSDTITTNQLLNDLSNGLSVTEPLCNIDAFKKFILLDEETQEENSNPQAGPIDASNSNGIHNPVDVRSKSSIQNMNEEEVPEIWWPVTIGALLAAGFQIDMEEYQKQKEGELKVPPPIASETVSVTGPNPSEETAKSDVRIDKDAKTTKLHSCPTCGKSFKERYNLNKHMKLHENIKVPCTWKNCKKVFATEERLREHVKYVHKKKSLKCPHCSQKLHGRGSLLTHKRICEKS